MKNKTTNIITYLTRWIMLSISIIKVLIFVQKAIENTVTFEDLLWLPGDIKDIYDYICDIKYYSNKF